MHVFMSQINAKIISKPFIFSLVYESNW